MVPSTKDAYKLFHRGAIALSKMESEGMPVSASKLAQAKAEVTHTIRSLESQLRKTEVYAAQQRKFGKECNINSRDQLAWTLSNCFGICLKPGKVPGKYILDEDALRDIDIPYVDTYLRLQKLYKLRGTYLEGLEKEMVNGRVHGWLRLHNVKTFRGSADSPNLNNLPSRNKDVVKYVKGCICPPEGSYLVEIDFSALEVYVACCYHKDPTMIDYLSSGYDMHTAVSKQCYMYDDAWIAANKVQAKELRIAAKSDAVFSWMYGNYYVDVAQRLWKTATNKNMLDFLKTKGITKLGLIRDDKEETWSLDTSDGSFAKHIKEVEQDFWGVRFPVYDKWRKTWYNEYMNKGYFQTLTGFAWKGVEKRNFVINAPVQGSAFHCLLQSIIDIDAEITAKKMRSRLFLEIHDSLLAIVPKAELHDYVSMAKEIMTTKLMEKWKWLIIPLKVEVEISDESWAEKKAYKGDE